MDASCPACGKTGLRLRWQTFAGGRRHVRADCAHCGKNRGFAPQTPANVAAADACAPYADPAAVRKAQQGSLFGDDE
jgi:ssDNA-binding Zn-finger/Zn-ribbon topoisomerase 1